MIAMTRALVGDEMRVTAETRLAEIQEFTSTSDFLDLLISVEIIERVYVPDAFVEHREWSLSEWAAAIQQLPKIEDELWTFHRVRMVSECWQRFLTQKAEGDGGPGSLPD